MVEDVMASGYKAPEVRETKTIAARVGIDRHEKAALIVDIWRAIAKAEGKTAAVVRNIKVTHVVDTLLGKVFDEEIAQWGGFPKTDAEREALLRRVEQASKKKSEK